MATLQSRLQFMESQAAFIEPRMRIIRRERIRYQDFVRINREASPYADVIIYYSGDHTGEMADLANRTNNYPQVNVQEEQHIVRIAWKGLAYSWSDREIERAMMVGQSLQDRKVRAAFRIAEETKQQVCYYGDSNLGWEGLVNSSLIPVENQTSSLADLDDKGIHNLFNRLIGGAWAGANESRLCNALLLPTREFTELSRPMGNDAGRSVMNYIKEFNPYTEETGQDLMIRTLPELRSAGAGTNARIISYVRDEEVVRYHVLRELMFLEPQRTQDVWTYFGQLVLAGLEWMEPEANRYLDLPPVTS